MRVVYVCHKFHNDPDVSIARVRTIARMLALQGMAPIAPHLFVPEFLDESTERNLAMRLCLHLVGISDELFVCGPEITEGMRLEIEEAQRLGIPVVRGDSR